MCLACATWHREQAKAVRQQRERRRRRKRWTRTRPQKPTTAAAAQRQPQSQALLDDDDQVQARVGHSALPQQAKRPCVLNRRQRPAPARRKPQPSRPPSQRVTRIVAVDAVRATSIVPLPLSPQSAAHQQRGSQHRRRQPAKPAPRWQPPAARRRSSRRSPRRQSPAARRSRSQPRRSAALPRWLRPSQPPAGRPRRRALWSPRHRWRPARQSPQPQRPACQARLPRRQPHLLRLRLRRSLPARRQPPVARRQPRLRRISPVSPRQGPVAAHATSRPARA